MDSFVCIIFKYDLRKNFKMDRKAAETIAKTFTGQKFPEIDDIDAFAHFAQAMEFTEPGGKTVLRSIAEDDGEYFCEVAISGKVKRCYDYQSYQAIAETICECV